MPSHLLLLALMQRHMLPGRDALRHLQNDLHGLVQSLLNVIEARLRDNFGNGKQDVSFEEGRLPIVDDVIFRIQNGGRLQTTLDGVESKSGACDRRKQQFNDEIYYFINSNVIARRIKKKSYLSLIIKSNR